jgi:hypothetical protein
MVTSIRRRSNFMPRTTRFYFGRFNVMALYEDKKAMLLEGLRTDIIYEGRKQQWGLFEVAEVPSALGSFLTGYLVKFKSQDEAKVARLETHSIGTEAIPNHIKAQTRFYLHVPSGLISFHAVASHISVGTFRDVFCRLFEQGLQNFFVQAEIMMVEDRVEFFRALEQFSRICRVRVSLHPANPRNAKLWEKVDERLKQRNATSSLEELRNDHRGGALNIAGDEELRSKFYMAEDGYGHAEVTGEANGKARTVSTSKSPITLQVPTFQLTDGGVVQTVMEKFSGILSRFTSE